MKRLSIIVPIYNVELYLRDCLLSILSQDIDVTDYEIILINDGSTDNSIDGVRDLILKYPDSIVLMDKENEGLSVARNVGLAVAKGNYVLFVDSDDCIVSGTLSCLLNAAEENDVDMLRADYIKLNDSEVNSYLSSFSLSEKPVPSKVLSGHEALTMHNTRECYVWMNMFKRSFLIENKIQFIPKVAFEDIPFTLETYLKAERFCSLPVKFYVYRQRSGSIINAMKPDRLISLNTVIGHTVNLGRTVQMSKNTKWHFDNTVFDSLSIGLWYLSHYKSLFPYRDEIIKDLRKKVPNLWYSGSLRHILVSILLNICPKKYVEFVFYTTRQKY